MMEPRYILKTFKIDIATPGQSYSKKFDLDKNIRVVSGLLMSADRPRLLFYRGSQRIEISGDELYPEDYESKLLMSGISISPDEKFATLGDGVISGNGEVKVLYKDADNPEAPFDTYQVRIVLKCELK